MQLDEGAQALAVARLEVSLDVEEGDLAKWGFPKMRLPKNGYFSMDNPIKMDDLRVLLFWETTKSGCTLNNPRVTHSSHRNGRNQAGEWSARLVLSSCSPQETING